MFFLPSYSDSVLSHSHGRKSVAASLYSRSWILEVLHNLGVGWRRVNNGRNGRLKLIHSHRTVHFHIRNILFLFPSTSERQHTSHTVPPLHTIPYLSMVKPWLLHIRFHCVAVQGRPVRRASCRSCLRWFGFDPKKLFDPLSDRKLRIQSELQGR